MQVLASDNKIRALGVRLQGRLVHDLSVLFVLAVPIVSFPWFPEPLLSTVSPALLYPAGALVLVLVRRTLFAERVSRIVLFVVLSVLAGTALSIAPLIWLDYSSVANMSDVLNRWLRSLLTVVIASFIFVISFRVVLWLRSGVHTFVRLLWIGCALMFVVALLALFAKYDSGLSRDLYVALREIFSLRADTPIGNFQRVTLLAVEPSFAGLEMTAWWLAFLVAAGVVLRRASVWILCLFALIVAALTQTLTAVLGGLGLVAGLLLLTTFRRSLHRIAIYGFVLMIVAGPLMWVIGGETIQRPIARLEAQVHRVISGEMWAEGPLDGSLAVRYGLANTAFNVWQAYPLLGSGLGLSGYWFKGHVPDWVHSNPRMAEYWTYVNNPEGDVFPSAKNLYMRLLSEVGLVGTILVLALIFWCLVRGIATANIALDRYRAMHSSQGAYAILSVAAVLGTCAALSGYNSLDSFAVPFLWVWLGVMEGIRQAMRLDSPR